MEYDVLFRGKRVDNCQWVYGWYCKYSFGRWPIRACIIPSEEAENGCVEHVRVDPATVGQYTGTTDKNGIKIFDGDILSGVCNRRNKEYFEVRWSKGNCGFVAGRGVHIRPNMNQATMDAYEVDGNIHDNPELLDVPEPLNAREIIKGGTGYSLVNELPDEIEHIYPDYSYDPKRG